MMMRRRINRNMVIMGKVLSIFQSQLYIYGGDGNTGEYVEDDAEDYRNV